MPILNSAVQLATRPFPRAISPKTHAIIDYATAASFFVTAGLFWRRNKRAALGALIAGGAQVAVNLLTNYPGGLKKVINFQTHREIDLGLGAMTATLPEFLAFKEEGERKFFLAEGAVITAISQLSRFPEKTRRAERRYAA
jgi:Na+/proline symporter